ncbi:MAG: lysoplasmalogenase [Promethearchaeati archaeon]
MENLLFLVLYFIFAGLSIVVILIKQEKMQYIFKPLLIPLLIMYYIFNIPIENVDWFIVAGMTCGLVGNIFFMHIKEKEMFLNGLIVHSVGHGFYVFSFFFYIINFSSFRLWKLFLMAPSIIIVLITYYKIKNDYTSIKIAMISYIAIVLMMNLFSIFRLPASEGGDFWLLWVGTSFLLISSILIALNEFYEMIPFSEATRLGIYFLAQFFIVQGVLITTLSA